MFSRRRLLAQLPASAALASGLAAGGSRAQPSVAPLVGKFDMVRNRPWAAVAVAGQGPFRFVLDTGATVAVIRPELAAELALPRLDPAQVQGATAQRTADLFWSDRVMVADLRQRGAVVFVAGRPGDDFDGVLPGAMFLGHDVELDFAALEFRIFGQSRPDRAGFDRLPLVLDPRGASTRNNRMVVRVGIDGRPADLLVDTGGTGSILLSAEYVGKHRLWDAYKAWAPSQSQGVLDSFPTRIVRAGALSVGKARFARPVVHLTDPFTPSGAGGDGAIGMDVLRRFTLSLDRQGQALWLKPNAAFDEPFRYNRSGLEAQLDQGVCTVEKVLPGSPAERAGLRRGDRIPGVVDGRELARLDWVLSEAAGTRIAFDVDRDGSAMPIQFQLAELL